MRNLKPKAPKEEQGIGALPAHITAESTAKAVLHELQRMGLITSNQAKHCLVPVTDIVRTSNQQNEDFWKSVYSSLNAATSNRRSKETAAKMQAHFFGWLDKAHAQHKGNLEQLAVKAFSKEVVPRSIPWIRKQITHWRKLHNK